jgi:polysaccharide biosynthesis transport protein
MQTEDTSGSMQQSPVTPGRATASAVARNGRGAAENGVASRSRETPPAPQPWFNVLHAARLHWPWILLLGVPLSVALAFTAYSVVPTPYTAYAELLCQPRRFFWETKEDDPRFEVYKQTTMRMLKDPQVIAAALRDPKVASSKYVRESKDILEQMTRELKVSSPAQEFIRIELSGSEPAEIAAIVNAMTEAFKKEVVDKDYQARIVRLDSLKEVLQREQAELNSKTSRLRDLDLLLEAATPSQNDVKRQSQVDLQLQIRREISQLQPQIIELELLLSVTADADDATPTSGAAPIEDEEFLKLLLQDGEYARHARELVATKRLGDEWARRVQEPHPEVDRLRGRMAELETQLAERQASLEPGIRDRLQRSRAAVLTNTQGNGSREYLVERLRMLKALFARYQTELEGLQQKESKQAQHSVERQTLAEEIATLKETVSVYTRELQRRQVELENAPQPIQVHQRARLPTIPDEKKRYMATFVGGVGGIGLVAALFLLLEISAQRISAASQVRAKIAAPVLGVVPQVPLSLRKVRTAKQRVTVSYWRDVLREAFDGVQSMLLHNPRCSEARIFLVASSAEGEGKTTATSQLAHSFARSGYRVLLIDGDLRRPSLEKELGLSTHPGLCEVLEGELPLDKAIINTELAELDLLPAGQISDKSRGLLSRDEHAALFRELSSRYSFIFIDSAPALMSADTLFLSKHADGVLMVVRKDLTRMRRLEAAMHRFEMIGVKVLGLLTIGLGDTPSTYAHRSYSSGPTRTAENRPAAEPASLPAESGRKETVSV